MAADAGHVSTCTPCRFAEKKETDGRKTGERRGSWGGRASVVQKAIRHSLRERDKYPELSREESEKEIEKW